MPSPVGHVIAGIAAGWLVAGRPRGSAWRQAAAREALIFGALGALPDVDLLVGAHSGPTHSIGAAAIVAMVVWLAGAGLGIRRGLVGAAACFAAYGSHVLLDWLATDSSPPIGIMALWPFSRQYYESDVHVFLAISRRYAHGWSFVRQNLIAIAREIAILVPVVTIVAFARRRRPGESG
jgi:inner membrane protein